MTLACDHAFSAALGGVCVACGHTPAEAAALETISAAARRGRDLAVLWGEHVSPRRLDLGEIVSEGSAYGRILRVGVDVGEDDLWERGKRPAVRIPADLVGAAAAVVED